MNKLLKEAIADAKAVRETALANAKIALEEAFTPRIQSMLSAKLAEEDEMDMEEEMEAEELPTDEGQRGMNDADEDPTDVHSEEAEYGDEEVTEDEEMPAEEPVMDEPVAAEEPVAEEEDLELEAIIKELEDEMASEEEPVTEEEEAEEAPVTEEEGEEDVNLDEIINALREEEGEEEVTEEAEEEEVNETEEKELEEAYTVIKFLRSKINEVNLLNAKLLFSNKLFRNHSMNEGQKMKVIENFDRASNLREVKLVFATLSESFSMSNSRTKKSIKESYASKSSRSTAPRKKIISEGNDLAARWKKLANL
jgi:hypothetical protein